MQLSMYRLVISVCLVFLLITNLNGEVTISGLMLWVVFGWGTDIYLIIRRCARTGAFPGVFCIPNSVALASPTLWGVQWAIH